MTRAGVGLDEGYRLLRESAAIVAVPRDLVWVEGADAESYLQGQLSCDVERLGEGDSAMTLVLSPQGKVDAWARLTRLGPASFALDTDPGWGGPLEARLGRFLLRVEVELRALEAPAGVGIRGPGWREVALDSGGNLLAAPLLWPPLMGLDVLADSPVTLPSGVPVAPPAVWEAVRIEAGLPVMGAELGTETIPEEAGVVAGSASFDKGCYVGQELVARIHSRGGNVSRRLRGVVVDGEDLPPPGSEVVVEGKVAGAVTSVARSPRLGVVALAMVQRRVELSGGPVAATVAGHPALVRELPLI